MEIIKKLTAYRKNLLYADFLFSYPATYAFSKMDYQDFRIDLSRIFGATLLYVHIPFCGDVCSFCNVHKVRLKTYAQVTQYLSILYQEIDALAVGGPIPIDGIYIAGGTPTILRPEDIRNLLSHIFQRFHIKRGAYIEVDAHPATLTFEKLMILHEFGVQQLSIGLQSMQPAVLQTVNRYVQTNRTIDSLHTLLKDFSFRIHFDFIVGLPEEDTSMLCEDVSNIIEQFRPSSISVNSYDHTIDTQLYQDGHPMFLKKEYHIMKQEAATKLIELVENKYGLYREDTFYFSSFKKRHANVLAVGAGAYGFIRGTGVYKNPDYEMYVASGFHKKKAPLFSERDEKIMFIIHNYADRSIAQEYSSLFGSKIESDFPEVIEYFLRKNYVQWGADGLHFNFKNETIAQLELISFYPPHLISLYGTTKT